MFRVLKQVVILIGMKHQHILEFLHYPSEVLWEVSKFLFLIIMYAETGISSPVRG
jgi:hypothetical protein